MSFKQLKLKKVYLNNLEFVFENVTLWIIEVLKKSLQKDCHGQLTYFLQNNTTKEGDTNVSTSCEQMIHYGESMEPGSRDTN